MSLESWSRCDIACAITVNSKITVETWSNNFCILSHIGSSPSKTLHKLCQFLGHNQQLFLRQLERAPSFNLNLFIKFNNIYDFGEVRSSENSLREVFSSFVIPKPALGTSSNWFVSPVNCF